MSEGFISSVVAPSAPPDDCGRVRRLLRESDSCQELQTALYFGESADKHTNFQELKCEKSWELHFDGLMLRG